MTTTRISTITNNCKTAAAGQLVRVLESKNEKETRIFLPTFFLGGVQPKPNPYPFFRDLLMNLRPGKKYIALCFETAAKMFSRIIITTH